MIERRIHTQLVEMIGRYPAVALLGPRQVGKTTLALNVAATRPSLERASITYGYAAGFRDRSWRRMTRLA